MPQKTYLHHGREATSSGYEFCSEFDPMQKCTTATEWYFILFASDGISYTSKNTLNIWFSKSALKEGSEEEKELHKNVKRVMRMIKE
uniref:Uncharacterized protein n=1 Tax=Rhizophagus irregularis (strain DAOM 181602 / DAOM 197198 / MUCL 43194) TaxID=747089 RepID=U9SS37_RHIID